jgi:hypothetical protein
VIAENFPSTMRMRWSVETRPVSGSIRRPAWTSTVAAKAGDATAVDLVDVGLLHLAQELPGVRGERLDVAALSLGVDRVEGEAALAAPRQPGDHDQAVARHLHVEVLEVVLARAAHDDPIGGHRSDDIRPM